MELRPQASAGFAPTNGASQVSVLRTAAVIAAVAASAVAQLQFAELGKRALPPDRDDTRSTLAAPVS